MSYAASYDYVVVGSGSSGSVVAARLSEEPSVRVLVLEAGPLDEDPRIHDVESFPQFWGGDLDWKYQTSPQPGLGGRQVTITQGRVLGGSTSLHALMAVRASHLDYDQWNASGADGWSYADLLPFFKKLENFDGGPSEYRGVGGPINVRTGFDPNAVSEPFLNAAVELGFAGPRGDYNGPRSEEVVGPLQYSITEDGRRCSAVDAYLRPARSRPNLTIETSAPVLELLFEGTRAVGVAYLQDGRRHEVRAEREVVLCAGAIASPRLLMLSGIGPASHLEGLGIRVRADVPGVGQNLQDHMQLPVVYGSKQAVPTTRVLCGNVLFHRTRPGMGAAAPDLQIIFSPTVPGPLTSRLQFGRPVCIFILILARPVSQGEVRLASAEPMAMPVVNPNYLARDTDLRTFRDGVELVRRLTATSSFAPMNDGEIAPGATSDADYIRAAASTIWHPAGTCRMGHDARAVVDPQLRVHGFEGLRVADASVMPNVTAGNTNIPCAMIGEKAAAMISARP